jgi:hypothetical protein
MPQQKEVARSGSHIGRNKVNLSYIKFLWKKFSASGANCVEIKEFDAEFVLIRNSHRHKDIRKLPMRDFDALLTMLKAGTYNIDSSPLQVVYEGEGFIVSHNTWPAPLQFTLTEWDWFIRGVKQGEFDEYIVEPKKDPRN